VRVEAVFAPRAWQPARILLFSRAAARAARAARCDLVHSFARTRHQDLYRAGGGSHADYMARAYGPRGARWRRATPRHAVLLAIEARVFADPSQTIQCNSHMVRDALRERHRVPDARLAVVENGVDLERFRPALRERERARVRAEIGAAADGPVWLLVGSELHRKGCDTALRALASGGPRDAELWVCGRDAGGPWRALAERLGIGARVRFLGSRADLERVDAAADALLLPTRYDAFANVCLEAAASGLPVVTSGANGAARWLGDAGLVVDDPEDVGGFAKALDALGEPGLRTRLGAAARARAETRSWARHVEELRGLYARLA
jgi:UDP-glucose:(heptosyl)LPS alpha-1,3-glucosyltransferase